MIVGSFSEHQNKTSDTDRYKRYFFTARVSQVNVNTMKRIFEQRSQLQVAKCLIVHVLSSSYNVSRIELRNKKTATQQWSLCVAIDIVLNQVGVYHERVYADNAVSKFWFVRSFPLNITPNSIPTLLPKMCPSSVLKNARPDLSFARWISTFFDFGDTLTLIQFSLWLCLSWMRMFMASTISVKEG